MAYPIDEKLVVGISSTALFDFSYEHSIYQNEGVEAFRLYQRENRQKIPEPGTAFPFIKRLLSLNKVFEGEKPVEVVILSRNGPDTGSRMMDAMPHYGLDITRAFFLSGSDPYRYMASVNACLYLSTNKEEVKAAIAEGRPAGYVLPCVTVDDDCDSQLRIAFDFDGVLVDDEAESQYTAGGLPLFHNYEAEHKSHPLKGGPLMPLLHKISSIQRIEKENKKDSGSYQKAIRVSIVTARNAPAHERMLNTLKHEGVDVDELFLTGGIEKKNILDVLRPQIFFDDQLSQLEPASKNTPCVHIPFGIRNRI